MKTIFLLLLFLITPLLSFSQYNPISQIIYGDGLKNIGYTISMNGLGNRMAIIQQGDNPEYTTYAKVYDLIDNNWYQVGNNITIGTGLANSPSTIALNQEGDRFVVGTKIHNENDFIKIYELESSVWNQIGETIISDFIDDNLGFAIDINGLGDVIICGGRGEEYAKVFTLENDEWIQKGQTLLGEASGDFFGESVSINDSGNIIAVAASLNDENGTNAGKLYLYEFIDSEWVQLGSSIYGEEGDKIGIANRPGNSGVNLNLVGDVVSIGSFEHTNIENETVGMVIVYQNLNEIWTQKGEIIEGINENGFFGGSHSINANGDFLVIGDFYNLIGEKVVVFSFENDSWVEHGNVTVESGSFFGFSVDINNEGNIIVVGTPDDSGSTPSEARMFEYNGVLDTEDFLYNSIALFPNPNNGNFTINIPESTSELLVYITDVSGKQVYEQLFINTETIIINQSLSTGMYFVTAITNENKTTIKIMVQNK